MLSKFFIACLWTETVSRFIIMQKKKEFNIQPSIFFRGTVGSPERARWSGQGSAILSTRVANHSAGFDLSRGLTEQTI